MKHVLSSVLVLCTVAGCTARTEEAATPQAYCERQAANDPDVVALDMSSLSALGSHEDLSGRIRLAKRRALQRCLREKGVLTGGGVEPLAPR
jgi:hypothetical protein